jgi:hypothetical protein
MVLTAVDLLLRSPEPARHDPQMAPKLIEHMFSKLLAWMALRLR